MDSDKLVKIIITILIIAVIAQAYVLYDLKNTIKESSKAEEEKKKVEMAVSTQNYSDNINENHPNPIKEFRMMQKEFDRIFSNFNTHFASEPFFNEPFYDDFFHKPLLDMTQNDNEYLMKMDIPGVKERNVQTSVENGVLIVVAEADETKESNSSSLIKKERYINKFQRSVSLPDNADISKMKTKYKDVVLSITIPKL